MSSTTSPPSATSSAFAGPTEQLPSQEPLPLGVFLAPSVIGIVLAFAMEFVGLESLLGSLFVGKSAHPYALFAAGAFGLFNVNSYLTVSVVIARTKYGVKLPNPYADKASNKDAVLFNCIQRGHQNFLEQYAQIVLVAMVIAFVCERPHTAGVLLLLIGAGRIAYAIGYKSSNVHNRAAGEHVSQLCISVGIGYAFLVALSLLGVQML